MQTDRNLLFGVLAFQDEYIDLAQLAAICRAWAADKSRSIPQLLVERQWLNESERDELERKAERKLKRFVGDAHATLGAVADSAIRDVLMQVDDPDIRAAIPELGNESRLGFHPDRMESSPDRSGRSPNLQNAADPASQKSDKSEPRYTRGQLQGEGSFGIVWLAYDKQLDREVALKELKTSKSRNPDLWKRFLREAQVTGKLQHPNIVPVYELDPRSGGEQPFYTMKPVKGRTLRKAIDAFHQEHKGRPSETLELNRLLQSFVQVCEALAYAHSRDVVHRDLKPENIVLGDFGEVIVLDWGEAKLIGTPEPPPDETTETVQESDAPLVSSSPALRITGDAAETPGTKLGTAKGSPGYMSPEQVRGDVHLMEPRTDVYGLGAILFDILIGHPPHQPTPEMKAKQQRLTIEDWRSIILANPTPRARQHNATIPVALDAICAKAMAAELSSRYSSANDLSQDVQRFLADEPVSVCKDPMLIRARRWMQHHQVAAATTAAIFLMSFLGLLGWGGLSAKHTRELENANIKLTNKSNELTKANTKLTQANQQEIAAREQAERQFRVATALRLAGESVSVRNGFPVRSLVLAHDAVETTRRYGEPVIVAAENALRDALTNIGGRGVANHDDKITCLVLATDGRRLVTGSADNTARVWELSAPDSSMRVLRGHKGAISCLSLDAEGRWLVTGSEDTTIRVWDLSASDPLATVQVLRGHEKPITSLALTADAKLLVTGSDDATTRVWDLSSSAPPRVLRGGEFGVNSLSLSKDGRWLAAGSNDQTIRVWDLADTSVSAQPKFVTNSSSLLSCLSISPDGRLLVAAVAHFEEATDALGTKTFFPVGSVRVWNLSSADPEATSRELRGHTRRITCLSLSPDGRKLATGSEDFTACVWDLADTDRSATHRVMYGHLSGIESVSFSPDARWLVTGSKDKTARAWDLSSSDPVATVKVLRGHDSDITCLSFSSDGCLLATGSADKTARLWNFALQDSDAASHVLRGSGVPFHGLALGPDGRWLVAGSEQNKEIWLWDLSASVPATSVRKLEGHSRGVGCVIFSPNGRWLLTGSADGSACVFDMSARDPSVAHVLHHDHYVWCLSVSNDDRWLATGSLDGTARVWDLLSPDPNTTVRVFRGHERDILSLAFSPNGRWLATGSWDKTARVWDLMSPDPNSTVRVLRGHQDLINANCVAMNSASRWLITGSNDKTARVWDLASSEPNTTCRILNGHTEPINCLLLAIEGSRLITGSDDGTSRVWDLSVDDPATTARVLRGHESPIRCLSLNHDGRWLVTGSGSYLNSKDNTARIWDLSSTDPAATARILRGHAESINCLSLSSDGDWLVTASNDGTARVWELRLERLLNAARLTAGRGLTPEEIQQHSVPEELAKMAQPADHDRLPIFFRPTSDFFRPDPRWQEQQITEATQRNDWFAVTFHRTRLLLLKPDDEPLWQQLQQVAQQTINAGVPLPPDTVKLFQSRGTPLPK